ncbi:MAG: hypothetical protein AAGB23_08770 [Pseudomonadota bacterium]
MSHQLKSTSSTRPLRVAYLVDLENSAAELLDAVFAECYSRWGGRWTLVVPCKEGKPLDKYVDWLERWDPDLIYSYVELGIEDHSLLHERIYPSSIQVHKSYGEDPPRAWRPSLRFRAVSSLSVLPWLAARRDAFRDGPSSLLDVYWSEPDPPRWILDSFGMPRKSEGTTAVVEAASSAVPTNTLISKENIENRTLGKSSTAQYVVGQDEWLSIYASSPNALSLADASSFVSQRLNLPSSIYPSSLSLVVGDTLDDRLVFWNGFHSHSLNAPGLYSLRVDPAIFSNQNALRSLVELIKRRNQHWDQGSQRTTLKSCSVEKGKLEDFAEQLRKALGHHYVDARVIESHEDLVPDFTPNPYGNRIRHIWSHREPSVVETTWFSGSEVRCAKPLPPQFQELSSLPLPLRDGIWMIDIRIDRAENHSQYSNVTHWWRLPKRLRLALQFIKSGSVPAHNAGIIDLIARVCSEGQLSVPSDLDADAPQISLPKDSAILRHGLFQPNDWISFHGLEELAGQSELWKGFGDVETSDKGRYLIGTLKLLGGLQEAFEFLTDAFWLELFQRLGGDNQKLKTQALDNLLAKLKKKEGFKSYPIQVTDEDEFRGLLESAWASVHTEERRKQSAKYSQILSIWEDKRDVSGLAHLNESERADWDKWERRSMTRNLETLSEKQALHQGQEWRCSNCFSVNWLGIGELSRKWSCPVCGHTLNASADSEWSYRLSDFLRAAIKDHGILATVWCLHVLQRRSDQSFFFLPSTNLHLAPQLDGRSPPDAEIDLLAVVDGEVILCEVKSSPRVSSREMSAFAAIANKIRPDIAMVAILDCEPKKLRAFETALSSLLDDGIACEVISGSPE